MSSPQSEATCECCSNPELREKKNKEIEMLFKRTDELRKQLTETREKRRELLTERKELLDKLVTSNP